MVILVLSVVVGDVLVLVFMLMVIRVWVGLMNMKVLLLRGMCVDCRFLSVLSIFRVLKDFFLVMIFVGFVYLCYVVIWGLLLLVSFLVGLLVLVRILVVMICILVMFLVIVLFFFLV